MIKRLLFPTLSMVLVALAAGVNAFGQNWERAVSLFNQQQYREAIREFHAVLRSNPDYWQAWYYVGAAHYQLKDYEDAIDSFQNYIKGAGAKDKEQITASYFIGFSYYQLKQYDKAIPYLTRYISTSEKLREKVDTKARAALGRSYIFTEKYNEAIPVLTTAAAEMKDNAANYYYIGFVQHKLNRDDQAVTALSQALAIDPRDLDSLVLLGDIQLARAKQNPASAKQAIATGEKLLAVQDTESAWALLGQAYLLDKQFNKAAPLLEKYARAHADLSGAWLNLGVADSRSNQWKPAAAALEQAIKLAPKNIAALLELGYVYESDKQYPKALSTYQQVDEISSGRDETARAGIERVKQMMARPQ